MHTIYRNTIENSPITQVVIDDDEGVVVYGIQQTKDVPNKYSKSKKNYYATIKQDYFPTITHKDPIPLYNLFDFIAKKVNLPAVTPEIDNAIQNFSAQYVLKLEKKASERYDEMMQVITQKLEEAQQEQKKLLVLVGETHYETDPQCGQLLALDICQKIGITNLLIERPAIDMLIKPSLERRANITADFLLNIISSYELQQYVSLHAIDPLRDDLIDRKVSGLVRNKAINETIVKIGSGAMCVVGVNHIPHIIADPELSKIYKFATFYNYTPTHYPEYDNKSSNELEDLLKSQELLALESDIKSQTLIKQVQHMENDYLTKYTALPNQNEEHTINNLTKEIIFPLRQEYFNHMNRILEITKLIRPKEMSDISIMNNKVNSIPSQLDAIDIAINVISQHSNESKLLNVLKTQKVWFKKIKDIVSFSPSYNEYMDNIYEYLLTGSDKPLLMNNRKESVFSILNAFDQTSVLHPDADLIGNWDTHPDC